MVRRSLIRYRHRLAFALGSSVGAALLSCVPLAPLAGQVIRGVVTERGGSTPVSGVVLSVLDARDAVVAQALSDERGAFDVRLPSIGMYSLDVKRIGVKRIRMAPFAVGEGETRRVDVAVESLPTVLSSVQVRGRTSCVRRPETNVRTAALWDDARAALNAAVITRTQRIGNDTVVRIKRKLDGDSW